MLFEGVLGDNPQLSSSVCTGSLAGKPVSPRYEYRGLKKDGTEFWLEVYASLIEYNGKLALQSAYMDITERRRTVEALRPGIKSLFVSGYTDDAIVHHGILNSNVAFLQKPFSAESLAHKIREVIDS
jgi:DNA-binding NarL/FixJ family response regulator